LNEVCVPFDRGPRWHAIRAICFDLDNTLWDVWPTLVRAEHAVYAFLTERYPRVTHRYSLESLRTERERVIRDHPEWAHDVTQIRVAAIQRCAESVGYGDLVGQAAFDVFIRERNVVSLYRECIDTLEQLKSRYRLFTLTNGNADLKAIGIQQHFEFSVTAREAGALKPSVQAFDHVLKISGLSAYEVLHVGDDPVADVHGARAAGMHPVWLNRDGALWSFEQGAEPTSIARLDELLALLHEGVC
jgi:FMN hydrolase / 5-amino-6-(5-phospho-D-ribitylamino)uracil phosphatase